MSITDEQLRDILKRPAIAARNPVGCPPQNAIAQPNVGHEPLAADKGKTSDRGRYSVQFELRVCRLLDIDNAYGAAKFGCDTLRYAKLIPEDNPSAIDLKVIQTKVSTKKEECTIILLTKL